jgi:hypothetical protein
MANQEEVSIRIIGFRTEYEPEFETHESQHPITGEPLRIAKKTGKTIEKHWVDYAPIGSDKLVLSDKVDRLRKLGDVTDAQRNPAILIAHHRWTMIEPRYEAWKRGQEPVESGTPLAAWSGVQPSQIDALKMRSIYTVEELAKLNDAAINSIGLPHMRMLVDNARRYIASLDNEVLAGELAERDAKIEVLTDTVEELKRMLQEVAAGQLKVAAPAPALTDEDFDDPTFVDPHAEDAPAAPAPETTKPKRK